MKLQGVSIEYSRIDDDDFFTTWTFIIKGIHPIHSVGKIYRSQAFAQLRAEEIVYKVLTQGE